MRFLIKAPIAPIFRSSKRSAIAFQNDQGKLFPKKGLSLADFEISFSIAHIEQFLGPTHASGEIFRRRDFLARLANDISTGIKPKIAGCHEIFLRKNKKIKSRGEVIEKGREEEAI